MLQILYQITKAIPMFCLYKSFAQIYSSTVIIV